MKYNELQLSSHKSPKRVGRGIAGGQGKTAGRGTKGQRSRAGSGRRPGFEGGQNPMVQRLPKLRGFTSHRAKTANVYTGQLDQLGVSVTNETLASAGLVENAHVTVKLISKGEVTKKHDVALQSASESAKAAIEKVGGTFKSIPRNPRPGSKLKNERKKSEKKSS